LAGSSRYHDTKSARESGGRWHTACRCFSGIPIVHEVRRLLRQTPLDPREK
jgi:hypothetical protein